MPCTATPPSRAASTTGCRSCVTGWAPKTRISCRSRSTRRRPRGSANPPPRRVPCLAAPSTSSTWIAWSAASPGSRDSSRRRSTKSSRWWTTVSQRIDPPRRQFGYNWPPTQRVRRAPPCRLRTRRSHMLQLLKSQAAKIAVQKGQRVLTEFNDLVPTLRGLGLNISDVSLKVGVPPEVSASLIGSVDALDQDVIKELIARNPDNQTVKIVLEGLLTASNFRGQLVDLGFRGLRLDVRLGMFPSVKLGLLPVAIPATV